MEIKVLHITFDMRIGGTEMVIKSLIEGARHQYNMSIYCIESPLGPWGIDLKQSGIPIESQQRSPSLDFALVGAIRKFIVANNIDIVHCHQYTPWVYGTLASIFTKAKVIFTEHGRFYPDSSSWKRRLINPILNFATAAVTAISDATRQALEEFEFLNASKTALIYNGIYPIQRTAESAKTKAELGIDNETIVLGTIARFDPIKNHVMMLDAFKLALAKKPNMVLLMVGDGEERATVENKIASLQLNEHVILTGYQSQPAKYLDIMDVFLLSSLSEGTSMTLLEAMSLGKPCVVTHAGGNPEIILDGYNGYVTENDNEVAFANGIVRCVQPDNLVEYGNNAKQRFDERFHVSAMASEYFKLYESVTW